MGERWGRGHQGYESSLALARRSVPCPNPVVPHFNVIGNVYETRVPSKRLNLFAHSIIVIYGTTERLLPILR